MIAIGSICSPSRADVGRSHVLEAVAVAAVGVHRTDRPVLPALPADAGIDGFERPLSGQYSANIAAWLNSSAWAHRWWVPYLGASRDRAKLFPGIVAIVLGCWGAISHSILSIGKAGHTESLKRDEVWFYIGLAIFTFWLTLGPKAGLYTLLYYTVPVFSFLRAPSRAGIVVTCAWSCLRRRR